MKREHTHLYGVTTSEGENLLLGGEPTVKQLLELFKIKESLENSKEKNGVTCKGIYVVLNQGMTKYRLLPTTAPTYFHIEVEQAGRIYRSRIEVNYHIALVESGKVKKDEEGYYTLQEGSYYFVTDKFGKHYIECVGYVYAHPEGLKWIGKTQPYRYVSVKEFQAGHLYVDSTDVERQLLAYGYSYVSDVVGTGLLAEERDILQIIDDYSVVLLAKTQKIEEEGYTLSEYYAVTGQARKERKYVDMGLSLNVEAVSDHIRLVEKEAR